MFISNKNIIKFKRLTGYHTVQYSKIYLKSRLKHLREKFRNLKSQRLKALNS